MKESRRRLLNSAVSLRYSATTSALCVEYTTHTHTQTDEHRTCCRRWSAACAWRTSLLSSSTPWNTFFFFSFFLIDLLADCRSWVEANLTARYHKKRAAADFCFKYFHGLHLMQIKILKQYLRVSYKAQANDVHRAQIYSIWLCLFSNEHSLIKFR